MTPDTLKFTLAIRVALIPLHSERARKQGVIGMYPDGLPMSHVAPFRSGFVLVDKMSLAISIRYFLKPEEYRARYLYFVPRTVTSSLSKKELVTHKAQQQQDTARPAGCPAQPAGIAYVPNVGAFGMNIFQRINVPYESTSHMEHFRIFCESI